MNQNDIVRIIVGASVGMHGIFEIQITESGAAYISSKHLDCECTLEPENTLEKLHETWELMLKEANTPPEDPTQVSDVVLSDGTVFHPPLPRLSGIWTKEIMKQWIEKHIPMQGFGPDIWVRSLQKGKAVDFLPMMLDIPTADGKTVRLPVTTPWSEIEKIASPAYLEQCAQARQKQQEHEAAEREARKNRSLLPYVCADGTWCCVCGNTGITTKYCMNCGSEKPE